MKGTEHPTCAWDSFITYRTTTPGNASVWAHDFGTTGEVC